MIASNEVQGCEFLCRDVYTSSAEGGTAVNGFWSQMTVRQFARLFGPFLGALLGGLLLIWYPCSWPCQEVVKVLRDALIVGGIIGLLIDIWASSVLIEHTTEQLSSRLVGYGLPKDAQTVIHKLVHETRLVFRSYQKVYTITEHPTSSEKVQVQVTLSYRVVNNGRSTESFAPTFAEEGMYNPDVTMLEYNATVVQPDRKDDPRTGVVSFSANNKVDIVPSNAADALENLEAEQFCDVRWDYRIEMPKYYSDVTAFIGVTVQPTLEVVSIPEGFTFDAARGDECIHAEGGSTWKYNRAFVAGQHVRAWWKPIE